MLKTIAASTTALLIASSAHAAQVGDVFYIYMENHNWTQPASLTGINQISGNSAAPFINSLVTPGNPNAAQVSYASNYVNVSPGLHPSEPNYVWQEAGLLGPLNDANPYPNNIVNAPNLSAVLQSKGISWKSYQEDTDLLNTSGQNFNAAGGVLTNNVAAPSQYEAPLTSFSGTSALYTNSYNGSHQYNFASKHDGQLFFTATNGGNDPTASNPEASHYAPLQQLASDLANNTVARYNVITPNQYNDMHSALNTPFTYNGVTYAAGSDEEQIALGDNFLSQIVPLIEASQAYKNNGEIVIWNDETEGAGTATAGYTSMEIIISPLAKGNAYTNTIQYTHSNDLRTIQDILGVQNVPLGAAATAYNMSDLYKAGAIPEPATWTMMLVGAGLAGATARRRRFFAA
ncbi:MAG: phosphoesterase [Caulobacteraceae bacterium]|nr:phosphoesterase [Caulobacteraceae bacterium]